MSEQVVYNIQKAQGTPEHTLDPAPFDPTPMIEGAGRAIEAGIGALGANRGGGSKKTDYSPLARALEKYNDTVKGREVSHPEQEDLWNSLVEWAGSQGYSHSEIDGYSKTIGVDIPNSYLREYQTRAQTAREAQFKAIEVNATQAYPDLDTDKAISLYTRDLADSMFIPQMGSMRQSMDGEEAKNFEAMNSAVVERAFSNSIRQVKMQRGPAFSSADLMSTIQEKGQELLNAGFSPEYVNYLQSYMQNLWEVSTTESDKRLSAISQTLKDEESIAAHESNMTKIANEMILASERNGWLKEATPIDLGTPEKPDVQYITNARLNVIADTDPDILTYAFSQGAGTNTAQRIFQSLLTKGGISSDSLTPTHDKIYMSKAYADTVTSSPNKETRKNGANTQVRSHENWITRQGPAYRADPRSKSSDLVRILNRNMSLDAEDYQNSPDSKQFNTKFSKDWLDTYAAVLGNELNNSLPLFDDKGKLRLIKVEKDNPGLLPIGSSDYYYAEDITEGYSAFGDRNVFTEEYAVGVPMLIQNISKLTGMSDKEAREMYNNSVIANSDVGKRIAIGSDTRNRVMSLESPLNSSPSLSSKVTEEILGDLLKGGRFQYKPAEAPIDIRQTSPANWLVQPVSTSLEMPAQVSPFLGPTDYRKLDAEVEMMKDFEIAKKLWGDDWYDRYQSAKENKSLPTADTEISEGYESFIFEEENLRTKPYKDSRGFTTIGVGRNLDSNPLSKEELQLLGKRSQSEVIRDGISEEQAIQLFKKDVDKAYKKAEKEFSNLEEYPDGVKTVLINMYYQLGNIDKFKLFKKHVKNQDWNMAAEALRKSDYYKQTPNRVSRLIRMMNPAPVPGKKPESLEA